MNLRALSRLFALCDAASADVAFRITVQYIEIYNETIRDRTPGGGGAERAMKWGL